jgi:hypothetical protein
MTFVKVPRRGCQPKPESGASLLTAWRPGRTASRGSDWRAASSSILSSSGRPSCRRWCSPVLDRTDTDLLSRGSPLVSSNVQRHQAWQSLLTMSPRTDRPCPDVAPRLSPSNHIDGGLIHRRPDRRLLASRALFARDSHREQAGDLISSGHILSLEPLCGGLPPDRAWHYLRTAADVMTQPPAGPDRTEV